MFKHLSKEAFVEYHKSFQGDTWETCFKCGGMCEINKIGSLMPGEVEYIAGELDIPVNEFRNRNLDGIQTPYGVVDVLKIKPGCTFLDSSYMCMIKAIKPVLCEVYPIVFEVKDNILNFYLDNWCPIVRTLPDIAKKFADKGIDSLKKLNTDILWYKAVELYDYLCVDYYKLFESRKDYPGYIIFTIDNLEECQIRNDILPSIT